jgi:hypothetical protein
MFRGVEVRLEQSKMLIRDTFNLDSLERPAVVVGRPEFLIVHPIPPIAERDYIATCNLFPVPSRQFD